MDDFSHYCWTFPRVQKSEVAARITDFCTYATTQFRLPVRNVQADNGTEFVNQTLAALFSSLGIHLRLSCPYTSPQNGKAERIIRTLNNITRTLLIHAGMAPPYWTEALATATYLLNRRPSSAVHSAIPYELLFQKTPTYDHLRVFGCLCYPNLSATAQHKLAPRSTACVFLGYPSSHKGYRCLDLSTRRVIISRHVIFDETRFPFCLQDSPISDLDFLLTGRAAPVPPTTAASPSSAEAPSLADVEQPRPTLPAYLDDPAILYQGPVLPPLVPLAAVPVSVPAAPPAPSAAGPDQLRPTGQDVPAPRPLRTPFAKVYASCSHGLSFGATSGCSPFSTDATSTSTSFLAGVLSSGDSVQTGTLR